MVLQGHIKKRKADVMNLAKLTFTDLPRLRARFAENQTFLDSYCLVSGAEGPLKNTEVFRFGDGKPLLGYYIKPWRDSSMPRERQE